MSDILKKIKKGEVLFKENEPCTAAYVIQSGRIAMTLERGGKKVEIAVLGPYEILGEQAMITNVRHLYGAEALQEARVVELSIESMKPLYEKSPANYKLFVRGLLEESKLYHQALRTAKMDSDRSPCPQIAIPRLFTLAHLLSRHIGKKDANNPDQMTVSWQALKQYASRFFGESTGRLRTLMDLFLKIKVATFEVRTTEEGDEELANLTLTRLQAIEDFAEFYQYHLFKGQRAEAIYVDQLALKTAKAVVEFSENLPVDHKGATAVGYDEFLAKYKAKYNQELKNTHLDGLEKKGLYATRKNLEDGRIVLVFDRSEFVKMSFYWTIISEIDKWNAKGFVDLNEKEEVVRAGTAGCPQCASPINESHKFCPNCGFALSKQAA